MSATRHAPLAAEYTSAPAASEEEVLRRWREQGTFAAIQEARQSAGARPFVFWEGPPTANGRPGIHHVLARTIKDAVCRWHTMDGRHVVRKAGWDTHGLPVELEVEKALGISGKKAIEEFGVAAFNARCRESVWKYKTEWEQLSDRIGYWLDYGDPYVTYDERYVESVWNLLARFHRAGLVYRGKRVLPYCGRCGTGLSAHELGQPGVYRDVLDPSVTVRFRRRLPSGQVPPAEPESFLAWTTTPWTLPSNFALAVHPEVEYVLARVEHRQGKGDEARVVFTERVWVAAARAEAALPRGYEVLETKLGVELAGTRYEPLFDHLHGPVAIPLPDAAKSGDERMHSVVARRFVTTEDGTGIVHQAPYGVDDWETAKEMLVCPRLGPIFDGRFQAPVHRPREEGLPDPSTAIIAPGTWFKDADALVVDDLKARHLLFRNARESHSYPHCWRCSTPLYYFPVDAWYIRTTEYKQRMIDLNRKVRWVPPEVGEKRFGEWLENNIDWNISRDRYWGTPLPFWVCEQDGGHEVAIESAADLQRRAGGLPEGFDNHKPLIDDVVFPCPTCGGTMRRTPAVLDCWFDSGAMPFAQYHWPFGDGVERVREQYPADFIAEGLDQTRGWFYTLHAIGCFAGQQPELGGRAADDPPYRTCVVNGLVLDKDGVKMSKRLGNVVDPWQAIAEHGADALRWYLVASGQPWLPKRFDPAGVLEVRRKYFGTLANSYKFFADYARIDAFDPADPRVPAVAERREIDRWLLARTALLVSSVRSRMEAYDLSGACASLEEFVVDDLSNWYIRRNRRRFWLAETGQDKLAAFATLHAALVTAARLSAPFAPFVADLLWSRLVAGGGSVHAERIPDAVEPAADDQDLVREMHIVKRVVGLGRTLRERLGIKNRQPLRALHVRTPDERALRLLEHEFARRLLLDELNVKALGSLAADDGQLCRLRARPNFKALGPRLGGGMKAAAERIGQLTAGQLAQLRSGVTLSLDLGLGSPLDLGPDDLVFQVETQADFDLETDGRYVVWLDTELDDELLVEGLAREVVNRVNGLRKESGLAPDDRIRLALDGGGDALLEAALARHAPWIRGETLALEDAPGPGGAAPEASAVYDLDGGRRLGVALRRA